MKIIRISLLLFAFVFGYITDASTSLKDIKISDKKSFRVHETSLYNFIDGSNLEFINAEFKTVYYIYYSNYNFSKVSEEFYNKVKIGDIVKIK
jgi:hypothetical protein